MDEKFLTELKSINEKLDRLLTRKLPKALDGATCKVTIGTTKGKTCKVDHTFTGNKGDEMAEVVYDDGTTGYEKVKYLKPVPQEATSGDQQH
jgi:hypothetical protein